MWLWHKILAPVLKFVWRVCEKIFEWAWKNPVASMVIGASLVVASWFIDDDAWASIVASWGYGLLVTGILSYVAGGAWDWFSRNFDWIATRDLPTM
jgi:hypothetical protein